MSIFFQDLYRRPQKVIDAMNAALPDILAISIQVMKNSGVNRIFVGETRANGAFLSLAKYEKFCHPIMMAMLKAYAAAGIEVMLHNDQDCTVNLPYFLEYPGEGLVLHTDSFTDIFQAKKVLGGRIALKGDVPPTMLTLGTPEQVDAYCRRLIEEVGQGGGFILSQGCDIPIDAKRENVEAMIQAAHRYGVYREGALAS